MANNLYNRFLIFEDYYFEVKKKICIFCENWESGGIESFVTNVLTHVKLDRFEIDIVTVRFKENVFSEKLKNIGVHFVVLSGSSHQLIENYQLFSQLLRKKRYDVIHFNIYHAFSMNYIFIAKRCGIAVRIAHSHNTALRRSTTKPLKIALHSLCRMMLTSCASELWACSKLAANFMFSRTALRENGFRFIPNGIETEKFQFQAKIRSEYRKKYHLEDQFVIGHVGRLCYQKNQEFLLDVFTEVVKRRRESILLLIGEGKARLKLERQAKLQGISDRVVFFGSCSEVERMLWMMDAFVFPSRFEGLGIALVEAQIAGLPVICSERIPSEAKISTELTVLPLSDGAVKWAESVLCFVGTNRIPCPSKHQFDICEVSNLIASAYEKDG